jgi:hypothetical protein
VASRQASHATRKSSHGHQNGIIICCTCSDIVGALSTRPAQASGHELPRLAALTALSTAAVRLARRLLLAQCLLGRAKKTTQGCNDWVRAFAGHACNGLRWRGAVQAGSRCRARSRASRSRESRAWNLAPPLWTASTKSHGRAAPDRGLCAPLSWAGSPSRKGEETVDVGGPRSRNRGVRTEPR